MVLLVASRGCQSIATRTNPTASRNFFFMCKSPFFSAVAGPRTSSHQMILHCSTAHWGSAGYINEGASDRRLGNDGNSSAREIAPQSILPSLHADVVRVPTVGRTDRVGRPPRRAREFGCSHGFDRGRKAGRAHDFGGKLVPRAVARVGDVRDPAGGRATELPSTGCEVAPEGRSAT